MYSNKQEFKNQIALQNFLEVTQNLHQWEIYKVLAARLEDWMISILGSIKHWCQMEFNLLT